VNIAGKLLTRNIDVVIAAKEKKISDLKNLQGRKAEILLNTRILGCKGVVGKFHISMDAGGESLARSVSCVIIAEEALRKPSYSDYGLDPSIGVRALSEILNSEVPDTDIAGAETFVFLTGLSSEGYPVITEEIMQACLRFQSDSTKATYVLTKNLKVAGNGLEKLYRETKKAGTVYIKFNEQMPVITQHNDGKTSILFLDEITQEHFSLTPDITVVDERICPSEYLDHLADIFKIDMDCEGFVQSDNVHRLPVFTNRKGILVAGPSRAIQSATEHETDAADAVLAALELFEDPFDREIIKAEISPGKCVRCLTCLRSCPHRAITLNARVFVEPEACAGCGICTAECPKGAISIKGLSTSEILGNLDDHKEDKHTEEAPNIIAFCCQRSGARAWALSKHMFQRIPPGLKVIEVPCGGSVSIDHVFSAFKNGADGVLVLTCHEGNCYSEKGNIHAKRRIKNITEMLAQMGLKKDRLLIRSLASNMGKEFSELTTEFENKIKTFGPSKLKKA